MSKYDNIVIASMRYSGEACVPDASGSGETCPGAPRSSYASIPWGIIDIADVYTRPSSYDISRTPYQSWKQDNQILSSLPIELAKIGGYRVSNLGNQRVLNPLLGAPHSYPSISFVDVLSMSRVELIANFAGKYILIGESGTLIHDSLISPVTGTLMDGVELHAHFLDGLLQNKMLSPLTSNISFAIIILLTLISVSLYFVIPSSLSPILAIVMMG